MATFNASYSGIGELLRSPEMKAEMLRRAEKIKAFAEATAPVGPESDPHRGLYKDSFEASADVEVSADGKRRAVGRVTNSAPYAAAVEYGYRGRSADPATSAHFTLTRALDAAKD